MSFLFAWGLGLLLLYYGITGDSDAMKIEAHVWFAAAFVISALRSRR